MFGAGLKTLEDAESMTVPAGKMVPWRGEVMALSNFHQAWKLEINIRK
jgi:hypothetical protein